MRRQHSLRAARRYLNLAHACGYVGLTPIYDHENLLMSFVKKHQLLDDDPAERALLEGCTHHSGAKTYLRFISLALLTLGRASEAGFITDVAAAEINGRILDIRAGLSELYQYHFQARRRVTREPSCDP